MSERADWPAEAREFVRGALLIAKKDGLVYYLKHPVLIHGGVFPLALFLAFRVGRQMSPMATAVGILALALFFTSSAVGPVITPWERRTHTYERLLSAPVGVWQLVLGDTIAGTGFGFGLSVVTLVVILVATKVTLVGPLAMLSAFLLSAFCFSSLGVLFSARATDNPSQLMMLSQLVRLPIIFVSGVFIPIGEMPDWLRPVAYVSPLTYSTDLVRSCLGASPYFRPGVDVVAVLVFGVGFLFTAHFLHTRVLARGL